jgi:glucose/arabinose dehydrogenase
VSAAAEEPPARRAGRRTPVGVPEALESLLALLGLGLIAGLAGCNRVATQALDQAAPRGVESDVVDSIVTPAGFRARLVVEGLNFPSSIAWDDAGVLHVLESHTVPVPLLEPRVLRVRGGEVEPVGLEGDGAPTGTQAIGLAFHDGWFYLSHEQEDGTWGVSRFRPGGGAAEAVVRGMPGNGDHAINYLEFDPAGNLYFGVGSATNSGVVSSHDPVNQKWLEKRPRVRDLACAELKLRPVRFVDEDGTTEAADDRATTGAFSAYGEQLAVAPASSPCTSALYRLAPGAREPELLAWGFRNPVALAWSPSGDLLIGMHGADIRGTRPVLDDPDAVYRLREGAWYGWPDYSAALLPITEARYRSPAKFFPEGQDRLEFVVDHAASGLRAPDRSLLVAVTEPHAALGGMTVVPRGGPFGRWAGQLLLSEMGDFRPTTDAANPDVRAGFQIESVEIDSGRRTVFARNRGPGDAQPASRLDLENGFERPVDVKFGPDGLLYVLDFGVFEPTATSQEVLPKTGKIFRIEPVASSAPAPAAGSAAP